MRTSAPIQVTVHVPQTEAGKQELARQVAAVHADFVTDAIHNLHCPARQKLTLLQAVIDTFRGTCPAAGLPAAPPCQDI